MNKKNLWVVMMLAMLSLTACNKDATKFTLDQKLDAIVKQISAESPEQPVNDEMKQRKKHWPMPHAKTVWTNKTM